MNTKHYLNTLFFLIILSHWSIGREVTTESSLPNAIVSNISCQNAGTNSDLLDDTFSFTLTVNGINGGWTATIDGTTVASGNNGESRTVGNFLILQGAQEVTIRNTQNSQLISTLTVDPPFPCSDCDAISQLITCNNQSVQIDMQNSTNNYTHFQWYKNGTVIPDANNASITVNESGLYSIRASDDSSFRCFDEIAQPIELTVVPPPVASLQEHTFCPTGIFQINMRSVDNLPTETFSIIEDAKDGNLSLSDSGYLSYVPSSYQCGIDSFTYQVYEPSTGCTANAVCRLVMEDNLAPMLTNIPPDITISCGDILADPTNIFAIDECPGINVQLEEAIPDITTCDYTITRTWTATDLCGNSTSSQQRIIVLDNEAPDIYRIHQLASGVQMIAGKANGISTNWRQITFPKPFTDVPLVFLQPQSQSIPLVARLDNITLTGFQVRMQTEEASNIDNVLQDINWVAVEAGTNETDDAFVVSTARVSHTNLSQTFPFTFDNPPVVVAQVQTYDGIDPVLAAIPSIGSDGFAVQLLEEQSLDSEVTHARETVAYWAAGNTGQISNSGGELVGETGLQNIGFTWTDLPTTITYHNPILLTALPSNPNARSVVVQTRQSSAGTLQARLLPWSFLSNMTPFTTTLNYVVIEGSLPLSNNLACTEWQNVLNSSSDIIASDLCSAATLQVENQMIDSLQSQLSLNQQWLATDECGNQAVYHVQLECDHAALQVKVLLQGALLNNNHPTWMRDDLRQQNLIPTTEPYSQLSKFGTVESPEFQLDSELLTITGEDAVVDWVLIELCDPSDPTVVLANQPLILQRDGDVIGLDGSDIIRFLNFPHGNYHIAVRHRNHLTVRTQTPVVIGAEIPVVDFIHETNFISRTQIQLTDGRRAMWAGNINSDNLVIYQGPRNDIFDILYRILSSPDNAISSANFIQPGYYTSDLNLDGRTIYQGPNNERKELLFEIILRHPDNRNLLPNFIITD
ncbi:MAG: H-type lectin domain-containing protein [Saprospiraceae bacterium]